MEQNFTEKNINWFPGHMAKTLNIMANEIKKVDMIIYVLDSRAPFSCINPEFQKLCQDKPILYVLNKFDLADENKISKIINILKNNNNECITLNSTLSGANKIIEPLMKQICKNKIQKYNNKGIKINLRAMVIGVPNCGKSTLINNLCGIKKTVTGNKAGVTRGKQWVALKNGFELLDTPGTLWPNLDNKIVAHNLALIGSIKNEVIDFDELSLFLIQYLVNNYPNSLNKYDVDINNSELEILDQIAKKKNFLIRGGEVDYDKTCFSIVDDFRKGKLGKITLDKVN